MGLNGTKGDLRGLNWPNWAEPCQTGSFGANWGQTEQNGDKRGQLWQNLLKDDDCLRDGDHPRDSYFP